MRNSILATFHNQRDNTQLDGGNWLGVMRRYLTFIAVANLVWESLQLPLYTIWLEAEAGMMLFAVVHCTAGDILIATATLVLALSLFGSSAWPYTGHRKVVIFTIAMGLGYTIFSEWLNTEVRESWAYSELMPTLPILGTGLSPIAQWIVIPLAAFWWARLSTPVLLQPIKETPL
mgnify:CR=1 FL=1